MAMEISFEKLSSIEKIKNSEALISRFSQWPSFQSSEILSLSCSCEKTNQELLPVVDIIFHLFEMTDNICDDGTYATQNHTQALFRFTGVQDLKLSAFEDHNVISDFRLEELSSAANNKTLFELRIEPAQGADIFFRCSAIEVLDVSPLK